MNLNLSALECVKVYADLLRKTIRLLTFNFKNEFQSAYPENKHVEAKIRQVLQQLRDLCLLEDLGRGIWKKI